MSMVFCRSCGKEMSADAAFCPHCGASQTSASSAPTSLEQSTNTPVGLSDKWKLRFSLLEKAGGTKMPKIKDLGFWDRMKLLSNGWGFLFGPLYYFKLGMWKKALAYTALGAIGLMLMELICRSFNINGGTAGGVTNFLIPAIFASRANVDYYKKIMLGTNGWI